MWQYVADFLFSELPRKMWQSAEAVHAMKDPAAANLAGAGADDVLSPTMAADAFNEAAFVERIWTQAPVYQGLAHGTRPTNPRNLAINMCFAYYRGGRVWFMARGHFLGRYFIERCGAVAVDGLSTPYLWAFSNSTVRVGMHEVLAACERRGREMSESDAPEVDWDEAHDGPLDGVVESDADADDADDDCGAAVVIDMQQLDAECAPPIKGDKTD